tara:strand:- start:155 stop:478 length:324 start_codon:yes stop_codon:yes gene_type:complete
MALIWTWVVKLLLKFFFISLFNVFLFNSANWCKFRVLMESENLLEQLGEFVSSIINKIEKKYIDREFLLKFLKLKIKIMKLLTTKDNKNNVEEFKKSNIRKAPIIIL